MKQNNVKDETVSSQFQASADEIDTILESYRELHSIYLASFSNLEHGLNELPLQYKNTLSNTIKAFEKTKRTVRDKQIEISNQLYAQSLVLLVGAAESITKEMFRNLLVCNIRKVNLKENINLPAKLVLSAHTDTELAELIFNIIADEGNPAEKLNFQNMRQLQAVMKSYLRIDVPDELISALHKYWQIRHIIIHNSAIIEQRFLDNLKKAGISVDEYILAQKVKVTKEDYDKCSGLLMLLFETFDDEIERLKLDYAIS